MAQTTPVMRQWEQLKALHPDAILLFRMGDFYELFGDDARLVARECELTLTTRDRDKGEDALPMCGVPYHAVERHIATLLGLGHRIAVVEQTEDPKFARGLVKRDVVRVLSPGTVVEDAFLGGAGNNYLAAVCADEKLRRFGLALVDVSTGEFLAGTVEGSDAPEGDACAKPRQGTLLGASDVTPETPEVVAHFGRLREELLRFAPSETLVPERLRQCAGFLPLLEAARLRVTPFDVGGFEEAHARLTKHFRLSSLRGFGIEEEPLAQEAAGLVLDYLRSSQLGALGHIRRISHLSTQGWMTLDSSTRRNLELVVNMRDGSSRGTLLALLDETRTGAGSRLLRKWLSQPLLQRERIERRLNAVDELRNGLLLRRELRDLLRGIGDIERLVARAVAGQGNARDLVALRNSLNTLPAVLTVLTAVGAEALRNACEHLDPCPALRDLLKRAVADEPPLLLTEGGLIKSGYSPELDEIKVASREGKAWIATLEETERARTGIPGLKVGFNNVFGYYIEITKTHLAKVPPDYTRKQTTTNAERYITPELKEREALILGAEDRSKELERRLFEEVRNAVAAEAAPLLDAARALASLDVYAALAEAASRRDYVRPEMLDGLELDIRSGRHPVVEAATEAPFVPNDCVMDPTDQQEIIITGPNASGKSTYLRQVALIVLMAQVGSFVPARSAKIGLVDRIFTRVGAQDDLATGQSTFTVEMNETANILNNATPKSLVILDEVGRGTSTYDGLSIAWAVAEHLHELGPKTLFATHYHHLNELEERLPRVKNYRIAVKEDGDQIIFLRRIIRGGTDKSFGIQVAKLAGLPAGVVKRASELLELFSRERLRGQEEGVIVPEPKIAPEKSLNLFATPPEEDLLRTKLRAADLSNLSPDDTRHLLNELAALA